MPDDQSTQWILWTRPKEGAAPAAPLWQRGDAETEVVEDPAPASGPAGPAPPAPAVPDHARHAAAAGSAPAADRPSGPVRPVRPGGWEQSASDHDLIHQIVAERNVKVEFQPIRDARRDQVVGYEALTRGPVGPLQRPDRLFGAATAAGLAGQLDWVARAAAFRVMLAAGLPPSVSLFVNVEADSLIEACPDDLLETIWQASARLRVFIDLTGQAMARYPFEVLETVRRARAAGWGVAVGDIEFSSGGLALLPVLEPDVLKLNPSVVTMGRDYAGTAVSAVLSEVEQTGAVLMVDRVENEAGRRVGVGLGAKYHSGHLFGKPGSLPNRQPVPLAPVPLRQTAAEVTDTPWDVLSAHHAHIAAGVEQGEVDYLLATFAAQAASAPQPPVIALLLPEGRSGQAQNRLLYRMLLERCPLVLIVGHDVRKFTDWHARTAELPPAHVLIDQFCFAALSPSQSMVLVARRPHLTAPMDLATSHNPSCGRQVIRHITDLIDTLAGGVRHGEPV